MMHATILVMKLVVIFLMFMCAVCAAATTTAPTSAPFANEPIGHGVVRFAPPPDWDLAKRADNDMSVSYKSPDGSGVLSIAVTPQQDAITDSPKANMAKAIIKGITESLTKDGTELLIKPRVEQDDRFYLKVHDRSKKDGKVADRIQMYRAVGLNLVLVSVVAFTDDESKAKEVHAIGETVLLSARTSRTPKPTIFGKTRVQITAPLDWKEEKHDKPNGLTAIYHDPSDTEQSIVVKSRILPRDAKDDAAKRDAIITQMLDADRSGEPPVKGAKRTEEPDAPADPKTLKTSRAVYKTESNEYQADTRFIAVGDVILSITTISRPGNADALKKTTDLLVETVKAVGK